MTKQDDSTQVQSQEQQTNNQQQEVKGHLLTDDQLSEWGNEDHLELPGLIDEKGNTRRVGEDTKDNNEDDQEEDNSDGEDDNKDNKLPDLADAEATTILEDPGDFTPEDYSFEVTVYTGEEGKEKPKTVKITSVEDAERLLEEDPNFGNAKSLLNFNRKVTHMESNLERDEREHQALKDAYDNQQEAVEKQQERVNTIANEIEYLVSKDKLPKVADKYKEADWRKPEVAKQPGVKEQLALIKYMNKENVERRKLGLSAMGALDAYNQMQTEATESRKATNKEESAQARKTAGARVSGTTPAPVGNMNVPKGIKVGRGGSLRDLGLGQW